MSRQSRRSTHTTLADFERELQAMERDYLWAATRLSEHALRRDLRALHEHYHPPSLLQRTGRRLSQFGQKMTQFGEQMRRRGAEAGDVDLPPSHYTVRAEATPPHPAQAEMPDAVAPAPPEPGPAADARPIRLGLGWPADSQERSWEWLSDLLNRLEHEPQPEPPCQQCDCCRWWQQVLTVELKDWLSTKGDMKPDQADRTGNEEPSEPAPRGQRAGRSGRAKTSPKETNDE